MGDGKIKLQFVEQNEDEINFSLRKLLKRINQKYLSIEFKFIKSQMSISPVNYISLKIHMRIFVEKLLLKYQIMILNKIILTRMKSIL